MCIGPILISRVGVSTLAGLEMYIGYVKDLSLPDQVTIRISQFFGRLKVLNYFFHNNFAIYHRKEVEFVPFCNLIFWILSWIIYEIQTKQTLFKIADILT